MDDVLPASLTKTKTLRSLPSIIEALSATHDIETVAAILNCKRKGNSPAIDEPCLQPPLTVVEISKNCWETALFEHPNVLDRLLICPSVYEIPWKAAVMAIRHYADDDDDCCNDSAMLDVDVSCFLQNTYLVWTAKKQGCQEKTHQPATPKSPIKKLRRGETATETTPAKWLLRMAEAILETTSEGYAVRRKATPAAAVTSIERANVLLSILASILSLAAEFDSTLLLELLDRTFIRHLTRPDMAHVVLLHLATRVDVQACMRPADWRGLQSSLRNEAALVAAIALAPEDRAEVTSCIVRIGVHCHALPKATVSKMLQRWADILILTLKACNGDLAGEAALVATFATLSAGDFKIWHDELLRSDTVTSNRPPSSVARALVLLAQGNEARQDECGWKIDTFWKTMISISSWSSGESFQLKGSFMKARGFSRGRTA
jgi:hypothetical protein